MTTRQQIEAAAFQLADLDRMEEIMSEIDNLDDHDPTAALADALADERVTDLMQASGCVDEAARAMLAQIRVEAARRADDLRKSLDLQESASAAAEEVRPVADEPAAEPVSAAVTG